MCAPVLAFVGNAVVAAAAGAGGGGEERGNVAEKESAWAGEGKGDAAAADRVSLDVSVGSMGEKAGVGTTPPAASGVEDSSVRDKVE